ncbi:uncharacterized protein LOC141679139 isoform X3 [Apium graveolens]|uniref:uncharacterized protein LOC141679139 isoform X3 n=1 Tax=Apium graveolens TaxID=4045 RepID=UPI003D7A62B5
MHFGWLPRTLKRALVGLSYVRFGDVFLRYHPFHKVKNYSAQEQLTVVAIHSACILVGRLFSTVPSHQNYVLMTCLFLGVI